MYVRLSKSLSIALSVTTAWVATNVPSSASAQRWHELENTNSTKISLDLETLQWDGSRVTYQTLIEQPPGAEDRAFVSISMIDCETQKRKHLANERQLPDGSSRKIPIQGEWQYFPPTSLIGEIRQIVCAKKP
jgi:hypothetical protein